MCLLISVQVVLALVPLLACLPRLPREQAIPCHTVAAGNSLLCPPSNQAVEVGEKADEAGGLLDRGPPITNVKSTGEAQVSEIIYIQESLYAENDMQA